MAKFAAPRPTPTSDMKIAHRHSPVDLPGNVTMGIMTPAGVGNESDVCEEETRENTMTYQRTWMGIHSGLHSPAKVEVLPLK